MGDGESARLPHHRLKPAVVRDGFFPIAQVAAVVDVRRIPNPVPTLGRPVALTAVPPCHPVFGCTRPRQRPSRSLPHGARSPGDLSPAQTARKSALAVRQSPPSRVARFGPRAPRRRTCSSAFSNAATCIAASRASAAAGAATTCFSPFPATIARAAIRSVLAYGEWVEQCVLRPVLHRQYVFTVPKLIRPFFAYRRSLLGELCRIIARALTQAYGAALPRGALRASAEPRGAQPGCRCSAGAASSLNRSSSCRSGSWRRTPSCSTPRTRARRPRSRSNSAQ
jgi:hypothetical protein